MSDSPITELVNVRLESSATILLIEPFYGGSHKQLLDTIYDGIHATNVAVSRVTLPAKKWHWRARTSALYLSQIIPREHDFRTLFTSSVLNLAELVALRPDLALTRKIVYFHENQLIYPVRKEKDRDFQYGYNQILTCLVGDEIIFNSQFNKDSFLDSITKFLKLQPDYRPRNVRASIEPKCRVLYFPVAFPTAPMAPRDDAVLHIAWPHRWEHDKDPETFFRCLTTLSDLNKQYHVSVLGESFSQVPDVFAKATRQLSKHIRHVGFVASKQDYVAVLQRAHVVVSTATHEFYGVSMLEAAYCGCFPLCPDALVYPEIYPAQCLYESPAQLVQRLARFCDEPAAASRASEQLGLDFTRYSATELMPKYLELFSSVVNT